MDEVQLKESRNLLESIGLMFGKRSSFSDGERQGMMEVASAESPQGEEWIALAPADKDLDPNEEQYIEPVLRYSANSMYETEAKPRLT